jgi:LuxR family maltose regulon positive regulatory protein
LAAALSRWAWIQHVTGDDKAAWATMAEAERVGADVTVADLLNPVPARRALLAIARDDVPSALRWTREQRLAPDDDVPYPREGAYMVLARVLLSRNAPASALSLLDEMYATATKQGRDGSAVEICALRALAMAALDDPDAPRVLADALLLGSKQGYVRAFADEGAPMRTLLARVGAAQRAGDRSMPAVPRDYLARVLGAFGGPTEGTIAPGLIEPLTGRELEVLRLLAAGRSNREIAETIVVTLDTVKKHVTHVLDKLGVSNRTAAVGRARELGLLS